MQIESQLSMIPIHVENQANQLGLGNGRSNSGGQEEGRSGQGNHESFSPSAGAEGRSRSAEEQAALGLMAFASEQPAGSSRVSSSRLPSEGGTVGLTVGSQSLAQIGTGLSAMPRKLLERVRTNEFVDFMELPPARGKCKTLSQNLGDQIVVVQAAELNQPRRIIPDLATWLQCYVLYSVQYNNAAGTS